MRPEFDVDVRMHAHTCVYVRVHACARRDVFSDLCAVGGAGSSGLRRRLSGLLAAGLEESSLSQAQTEP